MIITDGRKTVEINLRVWNGSWGSDRSEDFFNAWCLEYDDEEGAYIVDDVDACIEVADEWKYGVGGFADDAIDPSDKLVTVW